MRAPLTPEDWSDAAKRAGVDVPAIRAIAKVEAPRGAFLPTGEPTMLFERHKFHAFTRGRYAARYPHLSSPKPGGYGTFAEQPGRLEAAAKLDRVAALKATSFGQFQIMGFNHANAGFPVLQDFVNAMWKDERSQLAAFVTVLHSLGVIAPLRAHDWPEVAKRYNGTGHAKNNYAGKLREAFAEFAAEAAA